jgi:hypothetical protein
MIINHAMDTQRHQVNDGRSKSKAQGRSMQMPGEERNRWAIFTIRFSPGAKESDTQRSEEWALGVNNGKHPGHSQQCVSG